jgi:hydroxyethylthiazole kinase-like uncharacterized protein yjeF
MKLVTISEMQAAERNAELSGVTTDTLMENAGLVIANYAKRGIKQPGTNGRIAVLAGSGNNGGDGLVAARHLQISGIKTHVFLCFTNNQMLERSYAYASKSGLAAESGVEITGLNTENSTDIIKFHLYLKEVLESSDIVIDAILGTGKSRAIAEPLLSILNVVKKVKQNRPTLKIISVDIPTGLDADTGSLDPAAIHADITLTLGYPKRGLFLFPGSAATGLLEVVGIGLPSEQVIETNWNVITAKFVAERLPQRARDANKGSFGRAILIAGSPNYIGASILASTAAMRTGAGLVTLATSENVYKLAAAQLIEPTFLPLKESDDGTIAVESAAEIQQHAKNYDTMLIGSGLSQSPEITEFLSHVLLSAQAPRIPKVLDADALNGLAKIPQWWERLKGSAVLTPHPGELARLTGSTVAQVQMNRLETASQAAKLWKQIVVLKGAYTVVATPNGTGAINPIANPVLASAGTGDVLAGIITGLLSQGLSPFDSAICGVYVHGIAGSLMSEQIGNSGLLANDLLIQIPKAIKKIRETESPNHTISM